MNRFLGLLAIMVAGMLPAHASFAQSTDIAVHTATVMTYAPPAAAGCDITMVGGQFTFQSKYNTATNAYKMWAGISYIAYQGPASAEPYGFYGTIEMDRANGSATGTATLKDVVGDPTSPGGEYIYWVSATFSGLTITKSDPTKGESKGFWVKFNLHIDPACPDLPYAAFVDGGPVPTL